MNLIADEGMNRLMSDGEFMFLAENGGPVRIRDDLDLRRIEWLA